MSLHLPSRRLARTAPSILSHTASTSLRTSTQCLYHRRPQIQIQTQIRTIFDFFKRNRRTRPATPVDEQIQDLLNKPKPQKQAAPQTGGLAEDSIFGPEAPDTPASTSTPSAPSNDGATPSRPRNPAHMAMALNPKPAARARWQRKMVIRSVQHRGRLSKTVYLARNERQHLHKGPFFETSVKKLMPVARQIAGKSVDDALVQLRFSRKKVAQLVRRQLEYARDEATVAKGMGLGLGAVDVEGRDGLGGGDGMSGRDGMIRQDGGGAALQQRPEQSVEIVEKNGKRRLVQPTAMYIDQAWVGRGVYGRALLARARGRANIIRKPETSLSLLLKEERTRVRLADERREKAARKKPWVHHPDRPITAQRQFILW